MILKSNKLEFDEVKKYIEYDIRDWKKLLLLSKEYINARTKLIIQDEDGYLYNLSFDTIKQNYKKKQNFSTFDTRNSYSIYNINLWLKINNIKYKLLSTKYTKIKDYLFWECDNGHVFEMNFDNFYRGKRCSICSFLNMSINMTKTQEKLIKEISKLVGDEYSVLGQYTKSAEPILLKHNKCGFEWSPIVNNFLNGSRCPKCLGFYKTTEEIRQQIYNLVGEEYSLESNYVGSTIKISLLHEICGCKYNVLFYNFKKGTRCPKCNQSKGEKRIDIILSNNNILNIKQHTFLNCKNLYVLKFDFYLPNYNICLEYQGLQHYEPVDFAGKGEEWALEQFKELQIRDQIKRDYCKNNNIKLLEISYWDFDNIEEILKKELKINHNLSNLITNAS